jgi:hypothetical protein
MNTEQVIPVKKPTRPQMAKYVIAFPWERRE